MRWRAARTSARSGTVKELMSRVYHRGRHRERLPSSPPARHHACLMLSKLANAGFIPDFTNLVRLRAFGARLPDGADRPHRKRIHEKTPGTWGTARAHRACAGGGER